MNADALLEHAASVASGELRRARGRLRGVDPDAVEAVAQAAHAVAAGIARCLLETAERDPSLAAALLDRPNGRADPPG